MAISLIPDLELFFNIDANTQSKYWIGASLYVLTFHRKKVSLLYITIFDVAYFTLTQITHPFVIFERSCEAHGLDELCKCPDFFLCVLGGLLHV